MLGRRQVIGTLGAAGACLAAAGCSSPSSAAPDRLVVAAYPSVDRVARLAGAAWRTRHPRVALRVISRQFSDHHTAMMTALATGSYLPDVMALEVGFVGRFARGGGLQDLTQPRFGIQAQRAAYTPYAYDQALQADGAVIAAPSDIGPGTMLVRADVLQRAGVAIDELQPSWDAYLRAGQRVLRRTGARLVPDAADVLDIVIRAEAPPGDGLYFDAQGRPALLSARFERAFALAAQVRRLGLDARLRAWSSDWASAIRDGSVATLLSGAWLAGHLASWLAPDTRGRWRAAQLPQGAWVAFGGTFMAIPRAIPAARQSLAWDFIRLLTLDPTQQLAAFKAVDAFPALVRTYQDPFFARPIAFLGGQRARELWRSAALRIRAVAVHPQDAFAAEVVATALFDVMQERVPIGRALRRAQSLLERRVGQAA